MSWKTLLDAVGHFERRKTVDDITDKIVEELAPSQVSIHADQIFLFQTANTCSTTHILNYMALCTSQQFSIHLQCSYGGFYSNGFNASFLLIQERSVAPSPSSRLLIQSGPTLHRPLQLIDTLGGQSSSSSSDPLTSTSKTHPFDVFEQLLREWTQAVQ